jgi:SSS family transporter
MTRSRHGTRSRFIAPPGRWLAATAAFLLLLGTAPATPPAPATARITFTSTNLSLPPALPSGVFAATIAGRTLLGGTPPDSGATLWMVTGGAAQPVAGIEALPWAAAVAADNVVYTVGGLSVGSPSRVSRSYAITGGTVTSAPLPDLPAAVAGAGAAVIAKKLYVFGGATSLSPAAFASSLWVLDLENPAGGWREERAFPGPGRAFFASTAQYGMLCVFGGVVDDGGTVKPVGETWAFRPVPVEGTMEAGWKRFSDLPEGALPSSALALGQAQVLLLPSLRRTLPVGELAARTDSAVPHLFHTITDAWCPFDQPLSLRDAVAGRTGDAITLIGTDSASNRPAAMTVALPRTVRNLAWPDYLFIVAYFALLAGIGFWFSRKQESSEEFSLGNRKVTWWAAGISMYATGASAISFMAIPALAFSTNLIWTTPLIMLVPAFFIMGYLIYPLLRRMEITSTYEYLERRFGVPLRLIASAQCIIFQTIGRSSVVLVLPALAISSVTGLNIYVSVIIMGVLTTIYTALGGFEAVIWTEVFQGILKFVAPIMMITIAITSLRGGMGEFIELGSRYDKFDLVLPTWEWTVPAVWILFLAKFFEFTVTQAGDQPIIQRIFSSPLPQVRSVTAMNVTCGIIIGVITNLLGIAIFAYFRTHPEKYDPLAQNDQIVALFVTQAMPVGAAGIVVAAIFASAMATVASSMNSVATIFNADFYPRIRPHATDAQRLRVLKIGSYAAGFVGTITALLLAGLNLKSMMSVWIQIGALLGGGIVGVYSLGMFTRRANLFGAICGVVISIAATLLVKLYTPLHWALYPPVAILSCIVFGYLFSLLRPPPENLAGLTVYSAKSEGAP